MSVDITSQPVEHVELQDIDFHPLVRAELNLELKKWTSRLEQIPPERLQHIQGKVELLRWILTKMHSEILVRERAKAKLAEGKE